MPIKLAPIPEGFAAALEPSELRKHPALAFDRQRIASSNRRSKIFFCVPHPVYSMTLSDVAASRLPSTCHHYRYLIAAGEKVAGSVEISDLLGTPAIQSIVVGPPQVESFPSLIDELASEGVFQHYNVELRLLVVPAFYLTMIWLHSNTFDLFKPLGPVFPPFDSAELYDWPLLLDTLESL
jgi:hypothetical protein